MNLIVEEKSGPHALCDLRDEWQELFNRATAEPFLSWEWAATWQQWIGQQKAVRILCARQNDRLVGILPLSEETQKLNGWPIRIKELSFLGSGYGGADYLDILAESHNQQAVAQSFAEHLKRSEQLDLLEFESISSDSRIIQALKRELPETKKLKLEVNPEYVCPQVVLSDGWEATLKSSRRRDNFKRRLKALKAIDGFEYRAINKPVDAVGAFERFCSLHDARWHEHGGSEATGHESLRSFHRELVIRFAEAGLLHFDELWIQGKCIASIYGFNHGLRFYFYNSGYDPAFRNLSPGLVLLGLSIESACQRGIQSYDFLRGEEPYKFDWATSTRETVRIRISNRKASVKAFVANKQLQNAAKNIMQSVLPEEAIDRLRNWVRERRRGQKLKVVSQS